MKSIYKPCQFQVILFEFGKMKSLKMLFPQWQTKHSEDGMKRLERTRAAPTLPYLKGDVAKLSANTYQISFNSQLLGWHYQWVSTKHTCDAFHLFRAYIFVESAGEVDPSAPTLTYVGCGDSPRFQLYSRRRQRGAAASKAKAGTAVKFEESEGGSPHKKHHGATSQVSKWGLQMPSGVDVKIESALDLLKIGAEKVNRSVKGALLTNLLSADYQKTSTPPKFTVVQSFFLRHLAGLSLEQKINHCLTSGRMMIFMLQYNASTHSVKNMFDKEDGAKRSSSKKNEPEDVKTLAHNSSSTGSGTGAFDDLWDNLADILGPSIPDMDAIFDAQTTTKKHFLAPDLPDLSELREEIARTGDAALIRDLEATFNFTSKVSEFLLEEREISDELNEVFAAMATSDNVGKLAQQIKHEEAWLRDTPLERSKFVFYVVCLLSSASV